MTKYITIRGKRYRWNLKTLFNNLFFGLTTFFIALFYIVVFQLVIFGIGL